LKIYLCDGLLNLKKKLKLILEGKKKGGGGRVLFAFFFQKSYKRAWGYLKKKNFKNQ